LVESCQIYFGYLCFLLYCKFIYSGNLPDISVIYLLFCYFYITLFNCLSHIKSPYTHTSPICTTQAHFRNCRLTSSACFPLPYSTRAVEACRTSPGRETKKRGKKISTSILATGTKGCDKSTSIATLVNLPLNNNSIAGPT